MVYIYVLTGLFVLIALSTIHKGADASDVLWDREPEEPSDPEDVAERVNRRLGNGK